MNTDVQNVDKAARYIVIPEWNMSRAVQKYIKTHEREVWAPIGKNALKKILWVHLIVKWKYTSVLLVTFGRMIPARITT